MGACWGVRSSSRVKDGETWQSGLICDSPRMKLHPCRCNDTMIGNFVSAATYRFSARNIDLGAIICIERKIAQHSYTERASLQTCLIKYRDGPARHHPNYYNYVACDACISSELKRYFVSHPMGWQDNTSEDYEKLI